MYLFPSISVLLTAASVHASFSLDTASHQHEAVHSLASNLMSHYSQADHGAFPAPLAWWQSGGLWSTMVKYSHVTGDTTYDNQVSAALLAQAGPNHDFVGQWTTGNDDQLWWAITCVAAAEFGFTAPATGPSWQQLATTAFDQVASRWDKTICSGGLGWQISPSAQGYHYKNAISNGLLFQLAARLAALTGDAKYTTWATDIFAWSLSVGLVEKDTYKVYDGTDAMKGCIDLNHDQWSYNVGVYMYGAAVMLKHTGDTATWKQHVDGFVGAAQTGFFDGNGVMVERMCEEAGACNADQVSFKAFLSRWLAATAVLVPETKGSIDPLLRSSAYGALASCEAGPGGDSCGAKWTSAGFDGNVGIAQQMAALEVVQGLSVEGTAAPRSRKQRRYA